MAPSRRSVLKALGWGAAGLVAVAAGAGAAFAPALPHRRAPTPEDAAAWLRLAPSGRFELVSPRAEMGQGIETALRRIVAAEIGVPDAAVDVLPPTTARLPPSRATVGSDSIAQVGPLAAGAAAALADAIRARAAERLGAPRASVRIADGAAVGPDGRALALSALAEPPLLVEADAIAAARPLGIAAARAGAPDPVALRAILTGSAPLYADDVRLPGTAFGAVLRPPRIGARLVAVDDALARAEPGYVGLVREGAFAGILAESRGALERALARLAPAWSDAEPATQSALEAAVDVDAALARGPLPDALLEEGEETGEETGEHDASPAIDLRLDTPMAAHASIEPRCAVARFDGGRLEVWSGTQDPTFVRRVLADALGLAERAVVVHGTRIGGGFGARAVALVEIEAARLARAAGRPVKVQWTRAEELRAGFHRPPTSHRIRARLAPDGSIARWSHDLVSAPVVFTPAALDPVLRAATRFFGDPGVARGAIPPYAAARRRVARADARVAVATGPWRGLGAAPNVWAIETAIDALARAGGRDPVAFRLATIAPGEERLRRALVRVAALARWESRRSTPRLGYGVACGIYKERSYAAAIAEVEIDESGAARARRIWCAHDCGSVVDRDGVVAQVEGCLVWSASMALSDRLTLVDGHVDPDGFASAPPPRLSAVPEIVVDLVDAGEDPSGAGETAIVAGAAAVTNAIAAATGLVVTRLPYVPLAASR